MHPKRRLTTSISAIFVAALGVQCAHAQLAAFPGAQGFGADTTGGRNGSVYVVTNLNDSGPGSFRDAVSQSNRIVVFAVSGEINLLSAVSGSSNITILGQTAPGQGIALDGHEVSFSDKSNVIIQYMRFREGSTDTSAKASLNLGDLNGGIIDHVSAEFSQYDNIDAVGANSAADNITYQNDLVADAIKSQQLNLHEEGNQTTYLNNVFANAHGRDPLAKSNDQYVNNVAYDYGYAYTTGNSSGKFQYDIINNYFIAGPATTSAGDAFYQLDSNQSAYSSGNLLDGNKNGVLDGSPVTPGGLNQLTSEWSPETQFLPTLSTAAAFAFDTVHAGDSLQYDQVDQQIMSQVQSLGTQGSIYNEQDDDGLPNDGFGNIPSVTGPTSSANDGIPDAWAITHGLNPTDPTGATKHDALGYDMIEQYAQQLGDEYATQTWTNAAGDWTQGSWSAAVPGIYDHAQIGGGGTATVAAGDSANAFSIGIGQTGGEKLNVTGGWLVVQDTIYVGQNAPASFNLSGGTVRAVNIQLGNTVWDSGGNPTTYTGTFNFTGGTLITSQVVMGGGTPGNWTTGSAWTWNGGTIQAFGDLTINAPALLGAAGATVNTVGPDGVTYGGVISGALSGAGSFTKMGAGTLTLSASNQYTGSTRVNAGTLEVTGSLSETSSASLFLAPDATGATQIVLSTPLGSSYGGIGSAVTGGLFSRADLLAGENLTNNPSGKSVTMQWRLRQSSEMPPGLSGGGQISEVMTLTGMSNTAGGSQTDPFALQMNFTAADFAASGPATEFGAATNGLIHISTLTGGSWVNAVNGNFATGLSGDVFTDVQSSFSAFAAMEGITDSNLGDFLGSWGVDTADGEAWAVLDHNSAYSVSFDAVVPEPTAAGLALMAALPLLKGRRGRKSEGVMG